MPAVTSRPSSSMASGRPADTSRKGNGTPDAAGNSGGRAAAASIQKTNSSGQVQRAGQRPTKQNVEAGREKLPSKDGAAQRAAGEVAGLKDYQLGDCLGKGAFGSVYRALNWGTGETVAIKAIRLAELPKGVDTSLQLEIDLLKNLHHPNIVKYQGFVKSPDNLYIILEYCENGSLHSICKNFGKFPENLVALYMSQVLHGLFYLHEQGVIHRDIKGANILTTKEGLVKLADFGVATRKEGLHESSVVGTPYWMAPEVIELAGATTASDIWSLGCTVIELLDGKPPYHKLAPMPALFRIVNDDHPPLPEGASPAVRDFLMQCFQKDPNLRVSARKLLKHPWIVSARRSDRPVSKPTKYDEAIKSVQEWNEALKSPENSLRRPGRPLSLSPAPPGHTDAVSHLQTPAPTKGGLDIHKRNADTTKQYQSPEDHSNDNWDDDFATPPSTTNLHLPHLKPQDHFAGMLSSEKLKAYATFESVNESDNWDDNFEGDLTVKSPLELAPGDTLQTVRPFFPRSAKTTDIRHELKGETARKPSPTDHRNTYSKDSLPKTQILRPAQKKPTPLESGPPPVQARQPHLYRERSFEDYSDLIAQDDLAFQRKVASLQAQKEESFSPRLFHPSDLQALPRSASRASGTMRRTSPQVQDAAAMRRTRSSFEIQKYAEKEEDKDFSDIFSNGRGPPHPQPESESGSERGTLMMLNSKLSANSWLVEEEEDDDPFAELEESFDAMDLETNVARDKHARLCTLVEGLVSSLKINQPEDELAEIVDQLMQVLYESPDVKSVIISAHGMLPILEILETCNRPHIILRLLKIVNMLLLDNVETQENLCFVGGIPIVTRFAQKRYSSDIRLEAAAFVRQMYQTSTLTLQMFVSCGGLNVLVDFLEEDYEAEKDLVLIGVNGIWNVFELQGPTPKNDFCRIFSRSAVLYPLSLVLNRVLDEEGELAELIEGRIVNIFVLFSQAENHVKEIIADRMVLKTVLKDLRRMSPNHQITMLKFIKNLSMLATTLDALQNSNAIEVLTDLLKANISSPHFREISNQVLNIMYNLCRLSKERQEDAALNGVIPLLQRIVKTDRPLKEFALPILCDMAHSGKVGRKILWQNKGLQFYISLLADQYWQVTALDAVFIWLQEETAKVEEHLLSNSNFSTAIVDCFIHSKADSFENLLEPLQKLLRLSPPVASSLAHPDLFARTASKLQSKKALVRLNLLRIIRSICDASDEDGALLRTYGLYAAVSDLAKHDQAILVRELAGDLIKTSEVNARRSMDGARRVLRRSSSSTVTSTLMSGSSLPPTPSAERTGLGIGPTRPGAYFELSDLPSTRALRSVANSSPYRPASRDEDMPFNGSGAGTPTNSTFASSTHANSSALGIGGPSKSRLPRTRTGATSSGAREKGHERIDSDGKRLSLAPIRTENLTHRTRVNGHGHGNGQTNSASTQQGSSLASARRRRMTSQG